MAELPDFLRFLVEQRGADLHLKVGQPPFYRNSLGELAPMEFDKLTAQDTERIAFQILPDNLLPSLELTGGADFAHAISGIGRFRVNVFKQRGSIGMVMRRVQPAAPSIDALHHPPIVKRLAEEPRGLVLVTGPTGSGKTTTCAGMLNHINSTRRCSVVTLEDPIEVLHSDKMALINQREIGSDTQSYAAGLRHALRQDPDVIFVGEMRDEETVSIALAAAETGHFVLSTLHTVDCTETINRIIDFYPPIQQKQVRHTLAGTLRGAVAQRLVPRKDGAGMIPVVEVVVTTGRVVDAILNPDQTTYLPDIISEGEYYGMQSFDQALMRRYVDGEITLDDAMLAASNPHDLKVALKKAGIT